MLFILRGFLARHTLTTLYFSAIFLQKMDVGDLPRCMLGIAFAKRMSGLLHFQPKGPTETQAKNNSKKALLPTFFSGQTQHSEFRGEREKIICSPELEKQLIFLAQTLNGSVRIYC